MMLNDHFNLFERLARRLVEGTFDRSSGQRRLVQELARLLAVDIERTASAASQANAYVVELHPESLSKLLERSPDLPQLLGDYLHDIALEFDLTPPLRPGIELIPNQTISQDQVVVTAQDTDAKREQTIKIPALKSKNEKAGVSESNAFLIINGRRHIKLAQPLVTIGRHLDCDIVLDDPTASRQHAQFRWRRGHYIILDLGSKGGTLGNNKPVTKHILQNGDVIRLGDSLLVYGEESEGGDSISDGRIPDDGQTRQLPQTGLV
jgi:pSer/pThr/pTyr-binding forkhead associated (FHA) protein